MDCVKFRFKKGMQIIYFSDYDQNHLRTAQPWSLLALEQPFSCFVSCLERRAFFPLKNGSQTVDRIRATESGLSENGYVSKQRSISSDTT